MTMEQLWGIDPEPDPTPVRERQPRRSREHDDDVWMAEQQYDRYLDRMGD